MNCSYQSIVDLRLRGHLHTFAGGDDIVGDSYDESVVVFDLFVVLIDYDNLGLLRLLAGDDLQKARSCVSHRVAHPPEPFRHHHDL